MAAHEDDEVFGKALNPHSDCGFTKCPKCDAKIAGIYRKLEYR
jgi:hypothetical protein